jgi:glycosyltransferase involved in cell wall biosynthesis
VRVLLFSGFYLPGYKGGGPIKTIANLVAATSGSIKYHIVTRDRDLGDQEPYAGIVPNAWTRHGDASVFYCSPGIAGLMRGWSQLLGGRHDVVYLNSFFSPFFSFVPLLLARLRRETVVLAPRGEFSSGALSLKSGKKALFIRLFKLLGLHKGVTFQASTEFEAEDIRRVLGEKVDIFVAENIGRLELAGRMPEKDEACLRVVFLSRISPMKNLLYALEVLREAQVSVAYDIYGPLEDAAYWRQCQQVIGALPQNVRVQYKGELHPSQVVSTLTRYDVFLIPTQGENYGHVIAEALCAGLPALISDQTPWRNLQAQGIGWDFPLTDRSGFASAIDEAYQMTTEDYAAFRKNVLDWARKKFGNPEAIEANKAIFDYASRK